ncbi:MAG: hydantoinase/oxoprolinase family protein, partial [Actinobacteria bacterium]|nr:hydantoinase/oxoprolinase family protein [Actinomycetota bacterium]
MTDRRLGVDTGGTFTDAVANDGSVVKIPSTPSDPAAAVAASLGESPVDVLAHGTTVATNSLVERRGARVSLITNEGMADVIEIGRQDRPSLYDHFADRPTPLVERSDRLEISGRLDARGNEVNPLGKPPVIPAGTEGIAVCLLHADLNAAHEQELERRLAKRLPVSLSSDVAPEFREFERTVTTVLNAYLRPPCEEYLSRLGDLAETALVMTSAGGLVPLDFSTARPATLLLSGPAGGVRAGAAAARAAGYPDAVTFDMGGTSTDVCLVLGGEPAPAAQRSVAGFPVRLPSLDIHTIGAGGGSIAHLDPGGALHVGPRSAGAQPGPVSYGLGGTEPTVTDADLVAGRIPPSATFPGLGTLDLAAARAALERLGVSAADVIDVIDAAMVQAVRAVSVEQGIDPTSLALVAFGGGGPLHACAIADALDMAAVIVPPRAGVLSAAGILTAPRQLDVVSSWPTPLDHSDLGAALRKLAESASSELTGEVTTAVDCR